MAALSIKAITFDCAQTLVEVRWTLDGFARDCLEQLGLGLPEAAYPRLLQLYVGSLPAYWKVNAMRSSEEGELFWQDLTRGWFSEFGIDESWVIPSREVAAGLMYSAESPYFRLFPDVVECLDELASAGFRLAILSNWDYTLQRLTETLGIRDRFEFVLASLEEGVEKPDARLFAIGLEILGVSASEVIHIGDDPVDDVEGARRAGIRPILLERSREGERRTAPDGILRIGSLKGLCEVIRSIG